MVINEVRHPRLILVDCGGAGGRRDAKARAVPKQRREFAADSRCGRSSGASGHPPWGKTPRCAHRRVDHRALYVFVGLAPRDFLAPWWRSVAVEFSLAALVLVATIVAAHRIHRGRRTIEAQLAERQEAARQAVFPPPLLSDIRQAKRELEKGGFLVGQVDDLDGETTWTLTPKGRHKAAQLD